MNYILIFVFNILVSTSNQKLNINPWYQNINPNHEWKDIDETKNAESAKITSSSEFKVSFLSSFWNSYNISGNEDFEISFNYILETIPKTVENENMFKILISSNAIENACWEL